MDWTDPARHMTVSNEDLVFTRGTNIAVFAMEGFLSVFVDFQTDFNVEGPVDEITRASQMQLCQHIYM